MNPMDYIIIPLASIIGVVLFGIPYLILVELLGLPAYSLDIFLYIFFGWAIFYCVRFFIVVTRQMLFKRHRKKSNLLRLKTP